MTVKAQIFTQPSRGKPKPSWTFLFFGSFHDSLSGLELNIISFLPRCDGRFGFELSLLAGMLWSTGMALQRSSNGTKSDLFHYYCAISHLIFSKMLIKSTILEKKLVHSHMLMQHYTQIRSHEGLDQRHYTTFVPWRKILNTLFSTKLCKLE